MDFSVAALSKAGAFAGAPVKREITWTKDGDDLVFTVYVRRLSYHSTVADAQAFAGGQGLAAGRIASSIVDESGKPVFQMSDITGVHDDGSPVLLTDKDGEPVLDENGNAIQRGPLDAELSSLLMQAIAEVNGFLKKPMTDDSTPSESSGTS